MTWPCTRSVLLIKYKKIEKGDLRDYFKKHENVGWQIVRNRSSLNFEIIFIQVLFPWFNLIYHVITWDKILKSFDPVIRRIGIVEIKLGCRKIRKSFPLWDKRDKSKNYRGYLTYQWEPSSLDFLIFYVMLIGNNYCYNSGHESGFYLFSVVTSIVKGSSPNFNRNIKWI